MKIEDKRILIVYYSYEGNTEFVAESIQGATKGDVLRLQILNQKQKTGFSKYLWGGRQVLMGKKPELKDIKCNFDDYDLIFLGSPIWASSFAPAFNTFFDMVYGIKDKNIALFCCHAGGGGEKAFKKVKNRLGGNNFLSEISFDNPKINLDREEMNNQVMAWLESIEE